MSDSTSEAAPPLQGCLYCHAEGSTALAESKKLFGLGGTESLLTCASCGAVAWFEPNDAPDGWRIRYKSVNRAARYYYVMIHLGTAGWLTADAALEESRRGYVQRLRLGQAQRGDLNWLTPLALDPPPPLMSPDETVYLTLNPASVNGSRNGGAQDSGRFYVTDQKLHLLGHRRDWSHKLADVHKVEHDERGWRIFVGEGGQHYSGQNLPNQIDAQLFGAVVRALMGRDKAE